MEGLGKKLTEARLARGLTLEEAGRMTKIRPVQLQEIENEDFSQFPSLTYAKGFLLIYGKFLDVDVSPYLEAFETSETLTTDGYSYLQEAPEPEPIRPVKVRRRSAPVSSGGGRSSFMPLIIGILVLVVGFTVMKWFLQMQRLKPRPTPAPGSSPIATATASDKIIAPHAQPVETTTPPATAVSPQAAATASATATAAPTITPAAIPAPPSAEPEVRRAEPVHPEDAAAIPSPTPTVKRTPRPPRSPTPPRPTPTATRPR
jgi:cytoskeletal protein RodZ